MSLNSLQSTTIICSIISIISCILTYIYLLCYQKRWYLSHKLLFQLNTAIILFTIAQSCSTLISNFNVPCQIQAGVLQFFLLNSVLLTSCMCHHLYSLTPVRNSDNYVIYNIVSYLIPTISIIVLIVRHKLEPTDLWCWIQDDTYELFCFYIPLVLCIIYDIVMCIRTKNNIKNRHVPIEIGNVQFYTIFCYIIMNMIVWSIALVHRLVFLNKAAPFESLLCHIISTSLIGFFTSFVFLGFKYIMFSFIGCMPSTEDSNVDALPETFSSLSASLLNPEDGSFSAVSSSVGLKAGHISVFVYTFNLGEAPLPTDIYADIPKDVDIYFFTLQECMNINHAISVLDQYINSSHSYTLYSSYIGSSLKILGFHGYIVSLVFVKSSLIPDYHSIAKLYYRSGADMIITNAGNKGVAGISVRLASGHLLLFLGCHFSSDKDNKSNILKRIDQANTLFRDINIDYDYDDNWDLQNMHTVTFLAGDLNFRCSSLFHEALIDSIPIYKNTLLYQSLLDVPDSYLNINQKILLYRMFTTIIECSRYYNNHTVFKLHIDSASSDSESESLSPLYNQNEIDEMNVLSSFTSQDSLIIGSQTSLLSSSSTSIRNESPSNQTMDSESVHSNRLGSNNKQSSYSHNYSISFDYYLHLYDELYNLKYNQSVLSMFQEGSIHFPPTFRYQKNHKGYCQDYSNPKDLLSSFIYHKRKSGIRTPSYTDRILYHILPGYSTNIKQEYYSSNNIICVSDHKPVFSLFTLTLPPLYSSKPLVVTMKNIKIKSDHLEPFDKLYLRCPIPSQDTTWNTKYMETLKSNLFMPDTTNLLSTEYEYDLNNGYCSQITLFLNNLVSKDAHIAVRVHSSHLSLQGLFVIPSQASIFTTLSVFLFSGTQLEGTLTFDMTFDPC